MTSRRQLLQGAGAACVLGCRAAPAPEPPLAVEPVLPEVMERGHRVRSPLANRPEPSEAVDVAIVGGGVAGLSAAWALRGSGLRVRVYELAEEVGGTARASHGAALGAHYVTLPSPECTHVREMLTEFGVITGWEGGRPRYASSALCLAPEERLFVAGTFVEGLWPEGVATRADVAARDAFAARCAELTTRVGADGRPAFAIPVAASSRDPELRALAAISFAAWLDAQGLTAPAFRWTLTYACKDDFGAPPEAVSAWAGLHYFCSRRPDPADDRDLGTHVLSWPTGNGWLVQKLAASLGEPPTTGAIVRGVDAEGRVWFERAGDPAIRGVRARAVVLATGANVGALLTGQPAPLAVDAAPWLTVQLDVSDPPGGAGVRTAWDTVIYGTEGLGYIDNAHFGHTAYRKHGPSTLTWFCPLASRTALRDLDDDAAVELALTELATAHPNLRALTTAARVCRHGHGTAIPAPGLHALDAAGEPVLGALTMPWGVVERAHTDQSGMSLFEEASFHGVRAAQAIRARLG